MSSTDDDTFAALRAADDDSRIAPDRGFATRLKRQVESALASPAPIPTIDLPPRKETSVSSPTTAHQILTPYISVHDGAAALDWYVESLGATELVRYVGDDGRLGHGEFTINGAKIMLSDAYPEMGVVAATSYEGSSCALHLEVADCDVIHERAIAGGASSLSEPTDQPHGARSATIMDPFGHRWMLSQQMTVLTNAEINEQYDDFEVIEKTSGDT